MNLSKIINFEISKKGLKTVQGKAIKLLAGFLALMLLFTILSRSAYSLTTPKVTTTTISSMSIEHDMNISGQIYANRNVIISTQPNIFILSVDVAEGAPVKTGDVLFRLDLNDLDKQLQLAKDQLKKLELQQTDETSGMELSANNKKTAAERAAEDYYKVLSTENNNVQKALDELNDLESNDVNYKAKKDAYNQAVIIKENNILSAQRVIDDANSPLATNHSAELALIDINAAKDNIGKMELLKLNNGEIKTPKNGTVKKLDVTEGTRTSDGVAALLTDASLGYCFKAKVDRDIAKDLSKDDAVTLMLNGENSALENLKIDSMYVSIEDSNFFQITVNIPPSSENPESTANIEIKKQSEMYSSCVPLDALHSDGIKTYVLAISDKKTALGSETIAERIDVVVEDKNDTYAAISSNFESDQKLILSTNKPIQPGDRVRVEEE